MAMNKHINCPCTDTCPLQKAMNLLGGKWKMSLICSLTANGPTRYNDLKRHMNGISNTMLVKSLRELEDAGLIVRREYLEIPVRVEYETTELTKILIPILASMSDWAKMLK